MWCNSCQQDVPGIASAEEEGVMCCARCGHSFYRGSTDSTLRNEDRGGPDSPEPTKSSSKICDWVEEDLSFWNSQPAADLHHEWELQDDVRAAQRLYRDLSGVTPVSPIGSAYQHAGHDAVSQHWHSRSGPSSVASPLLMAPQAVSVTERGVRFVAWTAVCIGLMALICGAALLGWGYYGGRGELWAIGIPIAAAGQIALVVGLILQLDGLWQSYRQNAQDLGVLNYRLSDLRQTTTMANPPQSIPASPYHVPVADSTSTQATLADIKGRLDQISAKVAEG